MREKILNIIGFSLLALCFVIALGRILLPREKAATGENVITIRLAHWQLESGVRGAIDALAREYENRHPGVRVQQLAIPERIYRNWLITQLVGGTAPDIIQIGNQVGDERLARFFVPLTALADAPNPYNKGTELEKVPLRETIFDGMQGGYNEGLLEYFGIPLSGTSIRVFFNLDLLREITGSEKLPQSFQDLITLCEQTLDYSRRTGKVVVPIAGSRYNGPFLMEALLSTQTQKLVGRINPVGVLEQTPIVSSRTFAEGAWSFESPEVLSGLRLMRKIATYMQPGFMQLQRDDATFYFVQGRALMIASGSWDSTSILQQAPFPVGVSRIPFPTPDDPEFGEHTLGRLSEAGTLSAVSLGLTRASPHPETAADFLLFLASKEANQIWTDKSGWLPSVVGVKPHASAAPFQPFLDGYLAGLNIVGMPDVRRVYDSNIHLLFSRDGSAEDFARVLQENYLPALISDLRRQMVSISYNNRRSDTAMAALSIRLEKTGDPAAARKLDIALQAATAAEVNFQQSRFALEAAERAESAAKR